MEALVLLIIVLCAYLVFKKQIHESKEALNTTLEKEIAANELDCREEMDKIIKKAKQKGLYKSTHDMYEEFKNLKEGE